MRRLTINLDVDGRAYPVVLYLIDADHEYLSGWRAFTAYIASTQDRALRADQTRRACPRRVSPWAYQDANAIPDRASATDELTLSSVMLVPQTLGSGMPRLRGLTDEHQRAGDAEQTVGLGTRLGQRPVQLGFDPGGRAQTLALAS